jgi:hypothetical protein
MIHPSLPIKAPPRPSRGATHLAKVPGLILGHADLERQQAIKREADRKPKTGIQEPSTSTLHFSVGLARWKWDDSAEGSWSTCQNDKEWSIDLPNVDMSSLAFLSEIRAVLVRLSQRTDVKGWILPEGEGDWTLSHSNPRKGAAQEIADWEESSLLSDVIDQGAYNVKSRGNKKVVMLWLCWTPERPQQRSPTPTPVNTPVKKGKNVKKEIKKEIKQEVKQESKPEPPYTPTPAGKRPRAISGEMSIRKRNWRKELEGLGPVEDSDDLESLQEILKGDAGKGDGGEGDAGEGDAGEGDAGEGDASEGDPGETASH